jgi:hypothetical protein
MAHVYFVWVGAGKINDKTTWPTIYLPPLATPINFETIIYISDPERKKTCVC